MRTPYENLGLDPATATPRDIRNAYLRLAVKWHASDPAAGLRARRAFEMLAGREICLEEEYRGSEQERLDVLGAYIKCGGDIRAVIGAVLFARASDAPRFAAVLAGRISN